MSDRANTKEITRREKMSYIAGLIDGEGTITIARLRKLEYNERVMIGMNANKNNLEALNFVKSIFGGVLSIEKNIYRSKTSYKAKFPRARYVANCRIAINLLKEIYPFLIIKKDQVDLLFKLHKSKMQTWESRRKLKGFLPFRLGKDTYEYRKNLWIEVKNLHHPEIYG